MGFLTRWLRRADTIGEGALSQPARAEIGTRGGGGRARILIVEDHPLNRMVLLGMLNVLGFAADEACDGKQALDLCMRTFYDVIFMDFQMPVMDGIVCTKRIRAMAGKRPLIIGITADALPATRRNGQECGMDDFILKPPADKELSRVLAPWIAGAKCQKAGRGSDGEKSEWVDIPRLTALLEQTRMHEMDNRKRAFALFEKEAQTLLRRICATWESGEAQAFKDSAHGLKGMCRTMCLDRLAQACERLELASTSARSPDWSPVLDEFKAAFEPSLADLRRVLKV